MVGSSPSMLEYDRIAKFIKNVVQYPTKHLTPRNTGRAVPSAASKIGWGEIVCITIIQINLLLRWKPLGGLHGYTTRLILPSKVKLAEW